MSKVMGVIRAQHLRGRLDGTAAWLLRDSVWARDAFYVALAEAFDATLLTVDVRVARVQGRTCRIEVRGARDLR